MGKEMDTKIQEIQPVSMNYKMPARRKSFKRGILMVFLIILVLGLGALAAMPPLMMGNMVNMHVDFKKYYKDTPIVVYGLSMGAATAINSIGEIEDIDGLISISAYSSWEDVFTDNMKNMGVPGFLCAAEKPFVKLYTMFKYGFDTYNISPKNEIKKLGDRPALIMHSTGDSQVPYKSFERIIKNAPAHVETWTREGDLHFFVQGDNFDKLNNDPEYTERIIKFLDKNFDAKI